MTKDEPKHDRDWIVGCIKHDGFIETYRGDKANHIILEALEADTVEVVRCKDCDNYSECEYDLIKSLDNGYCSFGERSEE